MSVVTPDLVLSGLAVAAAAGTELGWLSSPLTLSWWSGASCELFLLEGWPASSWHFLCVRGAKAPILHLTAPGHVFRLLPLG